METLLGSYYEDFYGGYYELEFETFWVRLIPAWQFEEAATDEDFWEDGENLKKAIEVGKVENK